MQGRGVLTVDNICSKEGIYSSFNLTKRHRTKTLNSN